ncbi:MAG: aromatic ring-hydroxylating dioxygenase subunit alpha [Deltaproteobacteria bacterium]|nr:aromatic ring-hydroxylating dioxygenase subunit alpha [Deltaproteobacteria bacterium]
MGTNENTAGLTTPTHKYSVYRASAYWYIACKSSELRDKPMQVRIWDTPIALFRDTQGVPHALLDRCAHRNVPLSSGECAGDNLMCAYHGWQFNGQGLCEKIPALHGHSITKKRYVPAFPTREEQGFIWVFTDSNNKPNHAPYEFPHFNDPAYINIHYQADFDATIHATAENILDVPHTAFLHRGLFRGGEPNLLETLIRRFADRVECEYIGEPAPSGVMGKILAPGAKEVVHFDRFILPSIAQVEYQVGDSRHLLTTSALTPIADFKTRMYSVVSVKVSKWISMVKPLVAPFAYKVIDQDKYMLQKQTQWIQEFAGEQYMSTDVDCLGPSIVRLLKKASSEQVAVKTSSVGESPESETKSQILA